LVVLAFEGNGAEQLVPRVSLTVALVLTALNLGMLIFYIHHVAASLKSTGIASRVGHEFVTTVERLFPPGEAHQTSGDPATQDPTGADTTPSAPVTIRATGPGYLEVVDRDRLLALAVEAGLVIRVALRPSEFVLPGDILAAVTAPDTMGDDQLEEITRSFILGTEPALEQDATDPVHQLLEIAERALSTGINDPHTALACLNWLGVGLTVALQRRPPVTVLRDDEGTARLCVPARGFVELFDPAFSELRYYARTAPGVLIRMLEIIGSLRTHTHDRYVLDTLEHHADLLLGAGNELADPGYVHLVRVAHDQATVQKPTHSPTPV
jgi:uncharacterized membrane protein